MVFKGSYNWSRTSQWKLLCSCPQPWSTTHGDLPLAPKLFLGELACSFKISFYSKYEYIGAHLIFCSGALPLDVEIWQWVTSFLKEARQSTSYLAKITTALIHSLWKEVSLIICHDMKFYLFHKIICIKL